MGALRESLGRVERFSRKAAALGNEKSRNPQQFACRARLPIVRVSRFVTRTSMLTLFHHPFCPHSRFVRLSLAEYGPRGAAGRGAGLGAARGVPGAQPGRRPPGAGRGRRAAGSGRRDHRRIPRRDARRRRARLLPAAPAARVEVRRLASWFNDKFFAEVSGPLVMERFYKRHMTRRAGRRPARHRRDPCGAQQYPLSSRLYRLAGAHARLARRRGLSYADLAAAAHLSAVDYLGDVPWNEDEAAKNWYARVKSRPSFRPLLAETLAGMPPAKHYADLDF